jgi:hypothetical protein
MCAGPVYGVRRKPLIPSHPTGSGVHQPGAADPRFEALRHEELTDDESYDSWLCSACNGVIAIARRAPEGDPFDLPEAVIYIACLDCEALRPYHVHQRRVRRCPWTSPGGTW